MEPVRHEDPQTASRSGRLPFVVLSVLLVVLLVVPILWVTFPPMADLPQHAAQISILLDWNEAEPARSETYWIDAYTPYLLAYGLAWTLGQVLPLSWTLKLIIAVALLAFPWAVGRSLRRVGGPVELRWLAFPLALSYSYHWGFLNFLLATPLVFLFVELCVVHGRRPSRSTAAGIALASIGLFLCHAVLGGLACLVGSGLVALRLWSRTSQDAPPPTFCTWSTALVPFAAPLPLVVTWTVRAESQLPGHGSLTVWSLGWHRLTGLPSLLVGQEGRTLFALVGLGLVVLPFVLGARPSRKPWRWWPVAACLLLYFLWPEVLLTTSRMPGRFAAFLIPFLYFALDPPRGENVRSSLRRLLPALVAAGLLANSAVETALWEAQTRPFVQVIDSIPPGQRLLAFDFLRGSDYSPAPVTLSLPQWYLARRDGLRVDPSFAVQVPVLVRYRDDAMPELPVAFAWRPQSFDWSRHGGERYDYFLILAPEDVSSQLFPPGRTRRVAESGVWRLYRRLPNPPVDSAHENRHQ